MAQKDLGRIAMLYRGEWEATRAYETLDIVAIDGATYLCKEANTNAPPADSPDQWALMSTSAAVLDRRRAEAAAQRAEQSKTVAATAATMAEQYRNAAESAQNGAESARDAAQTSQQAASTSQQEAAQSAIAAQQAAASIDTSALMTAINGKADTQHTHGNDDLTGLAAWAKAPSKPIYTANEVGALAAGWCPYDVGDLYATKSTRHPAERWPGTVWTRIEAGRFLAAAGDGYALGSTGGAATVSLTAAQNGRHRHRQNVNGYNYVEEESSRIGNGSNLNGSGRYMGEATYGAVNGPMYTNSDGEGAPHENRPPYIAVNIWERTA